MWSSGQESACWCRRLEFDSWFGKIPHAEQLSQCGMPQLLKPVLEGPSFRREAHALQLEPPLTVTRESQFSAMKAYCSQNNFKNLKTIE